MLTPAAMSEVVWMLGPMVRAMVVLTSKCSIYFKCSTDILINAD